MSEQNWCALCAMQPAGSPNRCPWHGDKGETAERHTAPIPRGPRGGAYLDMVAIDEPYALSAAASRWCNWCFRYHSTNTCPRRAAFAADATIEAQAQAFAALFGEATANVLRDVWREVREHDPSRHFGQRWLLGAGQFGNVTIDPLTYPEWSSIAWAEPFCDCNNADGHGRDCPLSPIFSSLITELGFSPFRDGEWPPPEWWNFPTACPICGTIDLSQFPVPQYEDPICIECWQHNRHVEPHLWHCAVCKTFVSGLERFQFVIGGRDLAIVCPKHFETWDAV